MALVVFRNVLLACVAIALLAVLVTVSAKSVAKVDLKTARMQRRSASDSASSCSHSSDSDESDGSESDRGRDCSHRDDSVSDDDGAAVNVTPTAAPDNQTAQFSPGASGNPEAQIGGRRVSITPAGRVEQLDASGRPDPDGPLARSLNFEGSNWRVENGGRPITNIGNSTRELTIRPDGQLAEFDRPRNTIIPDRDFLVSNNQLFQVEGPRDPAQPSAPVSARRLNINGQPTQDVRQFTISPNGEASEVRATPSPTRPVPRVPVTPSPGSAAFVADNLGRPVATIGDRRLGVIDGNLVEIDNQGNPVSGGGFGQNFNFGRPWSVRDGRAQANIGPRPFTIGNDARLSEVDPRGGLFGDRQFFVSAGAPFEAVIRAPLSGGTAAARRLDLNTGQQTGPILAFNIGPDGQVINP